MFAEAAEDIGVHELALHPSRNGEGVADAEEFLLALAISRRAKEVLRGLRVHFMLTPDERSAENWCATCKKLVAIYQHIQVNNRAIMPFPLVIGVMSSVLNDTVFNREMVVSLLTRLHQQFQIEAHLRDWNGVGSTLDLYPWRSVSTILPFKLALNIIGDVPPSFMSRKFSPLELDAVRNYALRFVARMNGSNA